MMSLNAGWYSKKSCLMKSSRNRVAAGKLLNPALSPASALFCFGRSDKAGTPKAGEVRRVTIGVARGESLDRSRTMIFT